MSKIGFYSGTFDPVHVGHVEFALEAMSTCGLDKVIFLPEPQPREKHDVTSLDHRIRMLELAILNQPNLEVIKLPDDQFTVATTLPKLQKLLQGDSLVFLCGSDVVRTFVYRWEGLETLLQDCELIVGLRKTDTKQEIEEIIKGLNYSVAYTLIQSPKHLLASTSIREGNHTITDLSAEVADYIRANKLYS